MSLTPEQQSVIDNDKKMLVVSASAGSGKTFVLVKYIANLIINRKVPLKRFLVLTFTKAAAKEMKERLLKTFMEEKPSVFLNNQIDDMPSSDISTIDAFCEKILKQNIAKTQLDENFSILDEKQSESLKRKAFDKTIETFAEKDSQNFGEIYFSFKKNKEMIFECMESISSFFDSQEDEEYLLEYFMTNSQYIFNQASQFLNDKLKKDIEKVGLYLFNFCSNDLILKNEYDQLNQIISINLSNDFVKNATLISNFDRPRLTQKKIDLENQNILKKASAMIKEIIDFCKQFDFSPLSLQKQRLAILSNALLSFYKLYKQNYVKIKEKYDVIDFADCEKMVKNLLQDREILSSLQDSYDYIFVDEYQDTNKLQEAIIKPIAEKGMFMAVGDIKQGIYGFRNASMEIMLSDIEQFSKLEEGQTLFLKSNFRSDKKILNFVNLIFEKVMTKETCGVDYKNTSMLEGKQEFEKAENPSVEIIVCKEENHKEIDLPSIYSVKEDEIKIKSKNLLEAKVIVEQVKKFLKSKIYNPKTKRFENVNPQDIAILFRNRKEIMRECYSLLAQNDIPAISDERNLLFESPIVKILNNLLKLLITYDDDIALASVMLSPFGRFDFDILSKISSKCQGSLYQKCLEQEEEYLAIKEFFNNVKDFELLTQTKGAVEALKIFIDKNNFLEKLPKELMNSQEVQNIEEFYNFIYSLDAEYNIPKIVYTFENSKIKSGVATQGNNNVLLTTIHATKGLEYPIVILAGCGEDFDKNNTKPYALSKKFGLGTNVYDNISLTKSPSIVLKAIKEEKKQKEWVDEIMIFYVALTRAKNHLVLCGTKKDFVVADEINQCRNYYDLLFYMLGQNLTSQLEETGQISTDKYEIKVKQDAEENLSQNKKMNSVIENRDYKDLLKELSYNYVNTDICSLQLKNSVTSLNEKLKPLNISVNIIRDDENQNFIDMGNYYHYAIKRLAIENINNYQTLIQEIEKDEFLNNEVRDKIDLNLLLENILKIKTLCGNRRLFKEKEFVMSLSLKDAGLYQSEENIIVQGAIDCFAVEEEDIILIDYKYTKTKDETILKDRYKQQINLYTKAIEKAFKNKKIKPYLLSLRQAKIIEF